MTATPVPTAASVMVVAAHPDDIESWCAGTLALCVEGGASIRLLLVTSGDKGGGADVDTSPTRIAMRREDEARRAADILGLTEVVFLRHADSEVEDTKDLRRQLVMWIRRWQPELLFTHDPEHPWPPYLSHRDHRITGRATLDSVYPVARDPISFPEHRMAGLLPHLVGEVWLFCSDAPDTWVDIAAVFERKVEARLAHESQLQDAAALAQEWKERAAGIGRPAGLDCAEAFKRIRTASR
jgi:LmbE family N-acetylglucosaminyl deacetylase